MKSNRIFRSCIVLCITAILAIAVCGCEDLGEYESVDEYYNSFGDIVLVDGKSKENEKYSVEKYFYNKESRDNFLKGEDGAYSGVPYGNYVYVAIPFETEIEMDSIAMFLQSKRNVTVYINVYVTNKLPSFIQGIDDVGKEYETEIVYNTVAVDTSESVQETESVYESGTVEETDAAELTESVVETESAEVAELAEDGEATEEGTATEEATATEDVIATEESETTVEDEATEDGESTDETETTYETVTEIIKIEYDDPDPDTRIGEIVVHLKSEEWTSFTLNSFEKFGDIEHSVKIRKGQYLLLQIRNNSGVRVLDEENDVYVDPQTRLQLQNAEITMTNLLIRAINIQNDTEE